MIRFIIVTPIDEMEGDKLIVHPALIVNPLVIRKIESVEVEAPKPGVPKVDLTDKEPVAAPPAAPVTPVSPPMMVTLITFMDGKTMHVKEPMTAYTVLTA
jgi:hypothetical protein